LETVVKISRFLEVLEELGFLLFDSFGGSDHLLFLSLLLFAHFRISSADGSGFVVLSLGGFSNFLLVDMVEQVLSEELDRIVRLLEIGLREGFR